MVHNYTGVAAEREAPPVLQTEAPRDGSRLAIPSSSAQAEPKLQSTSTTESGKNYQDINDSMLANQ